MKRVGGQRQHQRQRQPQRQENKAYLLFHPYSGSVDDVDFPIYSKEAKKKIDLYLLPTVYCSVHILYGSSPRNHYGPETIHAAETESHS